MKRLSLSFTFLLFVINITSAADIYVSPSGSDTNSGAIETPLLTLKKAQERVREIVKSGCAEDITIYLREGRHELSETIIFSFEDVPNGGENSLSIEGYKDENPQLSAGRLVSNWTKCSDYPEGTSSLVHGRLWVADIPDGVNDFKAMFDDTLRLTRARGKSFQMPYKLGVERADSKNVMYNKDRIYLRKLPFDDQIKDWSNLNDIELFFNPVPWNMNFIPLESVDLENKVAYLKYEANSLPFSAIKVSETDVMQGKLTPDKNLSFAFVENVIDYLDEPGEWCVNTQTRKIYYYPKDGKPSSTIYVPQMRELIKVEGKIQYDMAYDIPVKNIHFKNIHFTHGDRSSWYKNRKGWGIQHDWDTFDYDNAMLRFRGAEDCSVKECEFSNSAGSAMRLDLHAQRIDIENNYLAKLGHMGILLCGYGPGTKDVNKNNIIRNNIIHHCGEIIWHGHGIFVWQSGENLISHNYIHDVPRKAIGICGVRCQILMKPQDNIDEAAMTVRWHEIEGTIDSISYYKNVCTIFARA